MVSKNLIPQGMKQINILVPVEWEMQKRQMGVTWRVLVGRGLTGFNQIKELKETSDYYIETLEKRNKAISDLNRRLYEMEDLLKKAGIDKLKEENN